MHQIIKTIYWIYDKKSVIVNAYTSHYYTDATIYFSDTISLTNYTYIVVNIKQEDLLYIYTLFKNKVYINMCGLFRNLMKILYDEQSLQSNIGMK